MKLKEYNKKIKEEFKETFEENPSPKPKRYFQFKIRYAFAIAFCALIIGLFIEHAVVQNYNHKVDRYNYELDTKEVDMSSTSLVSISSRAEYDEKVKGFTIPSYKAKRQSILSKIFQSHQKNTDASAPPIMDDPTVTAPTSPSNSEQNVQTLGVDEADIAKHDGRYIYVIYNDLKRLVIFNLNQSVVAQVQFSDSNSNSNEMFVYQDKIVILGKDSTLIYKLTEKEELYLLSTFSYSCFITSRLKENQLFIISGKYLNPDTLDYTACYYDDFTQPYQICSIIRYNLDTDEMKEVQNITGENIEVYASLNAIYIASYMHLNQLVTSISMFDYDLQAIGVMKTCGSVLNQFSMDEYDGYFRIVTTDSSKPIEELNAITIFDLKDQLKRVGFLNKGIGLDYQTVKSVRFDKTICYVVTYQNTDPLYEIDCSNPEEPKIVSSYQAPGYSNYLHNFTIGDRAYVLGLGFTDSIMETKISLYENKEDATIQIGKDFLISEYVSLNNINRLAFSNHKALFLYNDDRYFYVGANVSYDCYTIFKIDVENEVEPISVYKEQRILLSAYPYSTRAFLINNVLYYTTQEYKLDYKLIAENWN